MKKEYGWKVQHTGAIEKLEERFILDHMNDVDRKTHPVTDIAAAVDKRIATTVYNTADLSSTDDEHEVNLHVSVTRSNDVNSQCSRAKDTVDIQFPTIQQHLKTCCQMM